MIVWEVCWAPVGSDEADAVLADGWEPFAVVAEQEERRTERGHVVTEPCTRIYFRNRIDLSALQRAER